MEDHAAAVYAKGVAAFEAGDYNAAEQLFRSIVAEHPRAHGVWNALCLVALRAAAPELAAGYARRALELDRVNVEYINNLGIACGELGQFDEAEQAFRRALKLKPAYVEAHFNLGKTLHKRGELDEALSEYERAYRLDPRNARAQLVLAEMYQTHGQSERALQVLRDAGAAQNPGILTQGYAECIADLEGSESALGWLRGLLVRHPDDPRIHGPLAELLLATGQWREGWRYYCLYWRHRRTRERTASVSPLPARLEGKHILLRAEQGIGDILFYLRFVPELASRGASVLLECPARLAGPRLKRLLGNEAPCPIVEAQPADLPCDEQYWLTDLPALLDTEATPPALALRIQDDSRKEARDLLARLGSAPYLGLTWRAGTDVLRQREFGADRAVLSKEITPAWVGRAVRGWPGTIVSLQRGPAPGELEAVGAAAGAVIHDLAAVSDDLVEALALLEQLDEYVAVSSTNIHLLGGCGRAARVLVTHPPHWRWMRREGASVWFPGFSVYRQPYTRDWTDPLARLRKDLFG